MKKQGEDMQKFRWGLLGCGDIVRKRVLAALKASSHNQIIAVASARSEHARQFAQEYGIPRWYSDWNQLLRDPEIDVVYIASPPYMHAIQTITAAQYGKHVLCEKPMALNVTQCEEMIAACRQHEVTLSVAYYRHFFPVVNRLREILASGEIGDAVVVESCEFSFFNPSQDEPRHWFVQKSKSGGGPMMDVGCHRIELLMHLFGPIAEVRAWLGCVRFNREVEDTAAAFFRFASGPCGVLTVSHAVAEARDSLEIFGSRGSISVPAVRNGRFVIRSGSQEREETLVPHPNFHQPLIEDFTCALLEKRQPVITGQMGCEVTRILEQIYSF